MNMARPARARVDPDPGVLAANRGRNAANMVGTLGLQPEFAASFQVLAGSLSTWHRRRAGSAGW